MLPIVHYAMSRSRPDVLYAIRRHPGGQFVCDCPRYLFSKKPKHCAHTEWAWYEEERMNQQRKGGFDYGKTDYVEVAERVQQFYERFPDGSLDTEWPPQVISVGGHDFIAVRALAYRTPDDQRPGVGVAWEPVPGTTSFTKNSELMNAQTAAWGRAIAALGFATKGSLASREEVRNRQAEREEAPAQSRPASRPSQDSRPLREKLAGDAPENVDMDTGEILEDEPDAAKYERYITAIAQLMDGLGHKVNVTKLADMPGVRDRFDRDESASKTASWLVDIANARKAKQEAAV